MSLYADVILCLRFFSRIPFPATRAEAEWAKRPFSDAAIMAPVAGAIIGLIPGAALLAATAVGLPSSLSAALAIAALIAGTGALHEDALADCADGFGGGHTRERKLAIMRDSRIGTFGACAVAISLYVRVTALSLIAARGIGAAAVDLIVVGSLSRTACLLPLAVLLPARADGLGAAAGRPTLRQVSIALAAVALLGVIAIPFGAKAVAVYVGILLALVGTTGLCAVAQRQIGGQTGDVVGTAQQLAEIIALLVFAAAAG